jgi:uncharacterized membrane protein
MPHRHREVSRIEGFSDAVFAFAITLLGVSLEVPKTLDEMLRVMRGAPAFAITFALLFQIWRRQWRFFRAYDLEDNTVISLTGLMLFCVLIFVYPLKFMWTLGMDQFNHEGVAHAMRPAQWPLIMELYGAGMLVLYGILALMFLHAYRKRRDLQLTPVEILNTRIEVWRNAAVAGWALLSASTAFVGGLPWTWAAGFIYFGIGFSEWGLGAYRGRATKRLNTTDTARA